MSAHPDAVAAVVHLIRVGDRPYPVSHENRDHHVWSFRDAASPDGEGRPGNDGDAPGEGELYAMFEPETGRQLTFFRLGPFALSSMREAGECSIEHETYPPTSLEVPEASIAPAIHQGPSAIALSPRIVSWHRLVPRRTLQKLLPTLMRRQSVRFAARPPDSWVPATADGPVGPTTPTNPSDPRSRRDRMDFRPL